MTGSEYVKVVLYAYPQLGAMADGVAAGADVKAELSFRSFESTETLAEKIAEEILLARSLRALSATVDELLLWLSDEERFLLEYKYFRRKSELEKSSFCWTESSERGYFRRQAELLNKVCAFFRRKGLTEEEFLKRFGGFRSFVRVYRALKEGRAGTPVRRRKGRALVFQKSETS